MGILDRYESAILTAAKKGGMNVRAKEVDALWLDIKKQAEKFPLITTIAPQAADAIKNLILDKLAKKLTTVDVINEVSKIFNAETKTLLKNKPEDALINLRLSAASNSNIASAIASLKDEKDEAIKNNALAVLANYYMKSGKFESVTNLTTKPKFNDSLKKLPRWLLDNLAEARFNTPQQQQAWLVSLGVSSPDFEDAKPEAEALPNVAEINKHLMEAEAANAEATKLAKQIVAPQAIAGHTQRVATFSQKHKQQVDVATELFNDLSAELLVEHPDYFKTAGFNAARLLLLWNGISGKELGDKIRLPAIFAKACMVALENTEIDSERKSLVEILVQIANNEKVDEIERAQIHLYLAEHAKAAKDSIAAGTHYLAAAKLYQSQAGFTKQAIEALKSALEFTSTTDQKQIDTLLLAILKPVIEGTPAEQVEFLQTYSKLMIADKDNPQQKIPLALYVARNFKNNFNSEQLLGFLHIVKIQLKDDLVVLYQIRIELFKNFSAEELQAYKEKHPDQKAILADDADAALFDAKLFDAIRNDKTKIAYLMQFITTADSAKTLFAMYKGLPQQAFVALLILQQKALAADIKAKDQQFEIELIGVVLADPAIYSTLSPEQIREYLDQYIIVDPNNSIEKLFERLKTVYQKHTPRVDIITHVLQHPNFVALFTNQKAQWLVSLKLTSDELVALFANDAFDNATLARVAETTELSKLLLPVTQFNAQLSNFLFIYLQRDTKWISQLNPTVAELSKLLVAAKLTLEQLKNFCDPFLTSKATDPMARTVYGVALRHPDLYSQPEDAATLQTLCKTVEVENVLGVIKLLFEQYKSGAPVAEKLDALLDTVLKLGWHKDFIKSSDISEQCITYLLRQYLAGKIGHTVTGEQRDYLTSNALSDYVKALSTNQTRIDVQGQALLLDAQQTAKATGNLAMDATGLYRLENAKRAVQLLDEKQLQSAQQAARIGMLGITISSDQITNYLDRSKVITPEFIDDLLAVDVAKLSNDTANHYGVLLFAISSNPTAILSLTQEQFLALLDKQKQLHESGKWIQPPEKATLTEKFLSIFGYEVERFTTRELALLQMLVNVTDKDKAAFIEFLDQNPKLKKYIIDYFYEVGVENLDETRIDILFSLVDNAGLPNVINNAYKENKISLAKKLLDYCLRNEKIEAMLLADGNKLLKAACQDWSIADCLDFIENHANKRTKDILCAFLLADQRMFKKHDIAQLNKVQAYLDVESSVVSTEQLINVLENFSNSDNPDIKDLGRKLFKRIFENTAHRDAMIDSDDYLSRTLGKWSQAELNAYIAELETNKQYPAAQALRWFILTKSKFVDTMTTPTAIRAAVDALDFNITGWDLTRIANLDKRVRLEIFNSPALMHQLCNLIGDNVADKNVQAIIANFTGEECLAIARMPSFSDLSENDSTKITRLLFLRNARGIINEVVTNNNRLAACVLLNDWNQHGAKVIPKERENIFDKLLAEIKKIVSDDVTEDDIQKLIECAFGITADPQAVEMLETQENTHIAEQLSNNKVVLTLIEKRWASITENSNPSFIPFYKFVLSNPKLWLALGDKRADAVNKAIQSGMGADTFLQLGKDNNEFGQEFLTAYFIDYLAKAVIPKVSDEKNSAAMQTLVHSYIDGLEYKEGPADTRLENVLKVCHDRPEIRNRFATDAIFTSGYSLATCAEIALGSRAATSQHQNTAQTVMTDNLKNGSAAFWEEFCFGDISKVTSLTLKADPNRGITTRNTVLDATYEAGKLYDKQARSQEGQTFTANEKAIIAARQGREREQWIKKGWFGGAFRKLAYAINDQWSGSWDIFKDYRVKTTKAFALIKELATDLTKIHDKMIDKDASLAQWAAKANKIQIEILKLSSDEGQKKNWTNQIDALRVQHKKLSTVANSSDTVVMEKLDGPLSGAAPTHIHKKQVSIASKFVSTPSGLTPKLAKQMGDQTSQVENKSESEVVSNPLLDKIQKPQAKPLVRATSGGAVSPTKATPAIKHRRLRH